MIEPQRANPWVIRSLGAIGLGVLAVGACSSSGTTVATSQDPGPDADDPVTETTDAPGACADESWQTVDVGDFSFRLPAELIDQELQGMESLVGEYVGDGLTVSFDYGSFSSEFDELDDYDPTQSDIDVDGLAGRLLTADVTASVGGWAGDHITALHVQTDEDTGTSLSLWITYDDPDLATDADCITNTVDLTLT